MAANSKANLRTLIILSAAGIVSLYPLLFQPTGKEDNNFKLLFDDTLIAI